MTRANDLDPSLSPDFDPRVADWLEDDPNDAPDAVLDTVLAAFPSMPQRRGVPGPWRAIQMNRTALLGAAAAITIVVIGGSLLLRPGVAIVARPSATPDRSSAPQGVASSPSLDSSTPQATVQLPTEIPGHLSPVRTALKVPLSFSGDPNWAVLQDRPTMFEVAWSPGWSPAQDLPIWNSPRVAVGVPYGARTADDVFRTMTDTNNFLSTVVNPTRELRFANFKGRGFDCTNDAWKGTLYLFPLTRAGREAGVPTGAEPNPDGLGDRDWFGLRDGCWETRTIVFEEAGTPVVVSVFGLVHHGPGGGVDIRADAVARDLDLTFGP